MSGISHFTVSWKEVRVAFLWALVAGLVLRYAGPILALLLATVLSPAKSAVVPELSLYRLLTADLPMAALFAVGFAIPLLSRDRNSRIACIVFWVCFSYLRDILSGRGFLAYDPVEVAAYGISALAVMIGTCKLWDRNVAPSAEPSDEAEAVVVMLDFKVLGVSAICGGIAGVLLLLLPMLYAYLSFGDSFRESGFLQAQLRTLLPQFVYYGFVLCWMIPTRSALTYKWYLLTASILMIPQFLWQMVYLDPAFDSGNYRLKFVVGFFVSLCALALGTIAAIFLYLTINPEKRVEARNARKADRQAENARRWLEENGP